MITKCPQTRFGLAAAAWIVIGGLGCGPSGGYDSPQAAFDAYHEALANHEWADAFDAVTVETQQREIAEVLLSVKPNDRMIADVTARNAANENENAKKVVASLAQFNAQLHELMDRHDIADDQLPENLPGGARPSAADLAELVRDARQFYVDYQDIAHPTGSSHFARQELVSVEVQGETAHGQQRVEGAKPLIVAGVADVSLSPIEFRRISGRWYVHQTWETLESHWRAVRETVESQYGE